MPLTLELAERMLAVGREKARELGRTASMAIVDPAGDLIALGRMDGGRGINAEIALAKARGAAAFQRDASEMAAVFQHNPAFIWQLVALKGGSLMIDIGSVVIRSGSGELLGAFAVSGASAEEDEVIARAALAAAAADL